MSFKYIFFVENCYDKFQTEGEIKFHLRKIHSLESNDPFSSYKNLSRHDVIIPETTLPSTSIMVNNEFHVVVPVIAEKTSNMLETSVMISEGMISEGTIESEPTHGEKDEENGDLNFTVKYVSRNNITRSDIYEIQDDIQKHITGRIGEMIRKNVLNKLKSGTFSSSELISSLEEILKICDFPFKERHRI